jgi:hypothetical protein
MVVVEDRQFGAAIMPMKDPEAIHMAAQLPAHLSVSRSLARALVKYVSRRGAFGRERRAEIARRLGEVIAGRYHLAPQTSHDLLLCALYYRTFIAGRAESASEPTSRKQIPAKPAALELSR